MGVQRPSPGRWPYLQRPYRLDWELGPLVLLVGGRL